MKIVNRAKVLLDRIGRAKGLSFGFIDYRDRDWLVAAVKDFSIEDFDYKRKEESIIERDLELGEDTDVDYVGLTWCKRHGKEALYTHALQACIDYIFPYVEKEKNRCRIAEDSNYN